MNQGQRPDDPSTPRRIEVHPGVARGAEAAGGVRLGRRLPYQPAPAPAQAPPPEAMRQPREGWDLGQAKPQGDAQKDAARKAGLRKLLIAVGVVFVVVIALALILGPSGSKGVILTRDDQQLLNDYRAYLKKSGLPAEEVETKAGGAEKRMKAYRWAASVGESRSAEEEYRSLLLMDNDRSSPLYVYCVEKLKRQ